MILRMVMLMGETGDIINSLSAHVKRDVACQLSFWYTTLI